MHTFKDLYKVNTRFHRSVHIELDKSLDGYIITQTGIKVIERVIDALNKPVSTRAWSIIGPYGSGKSAFVVFLKSLFGRSKDPSVVDARSLLKKENKVLHGKLFDSQNKIVESEKGFCLALVSAGRESLEYAILKGLLNGLNDFYVSSASKPANLIKTIETAIQCCEKGNTPSNDEIIQLCADIITNVKKSKGSGLLLVIDELGKTLESAALDHNNDIFILQKLAEVASRRNNPPFLLFTVLHQTFDHYASKLDIEKRNEWSKVQGRFEDIPFVDSSDQVFKLISSAIIPIDDKKNGSHIKSSTENLFTSYNHIFKDDHSRLSKRSIKLLRKCLPLHPLTSMALVPLFRSKFSQNERSLFAFITSTEPFGFVDFLNKTQPHDFPDKYYYYELHNLYDYLVANLGISLFTHHNGKKWIEMDNALSRTSDELERKVIKTLGVLDLFADFSGFSINEEMISFALNAISKKEQENIKEAVKSLCRKSVIVYRRYSSSYRVWGGSDIDIEQKVLDAKQEAVSGQSILTSLNKYFPLRPKVAKRHLHKTGTLRYFKLRYVAASELEVELKQGFENEDGQILLVLQMGNDKKWKVKELQGLLKQSDHEISSRTLIGVSLESDSLISSFKELLALQLVRKSTPELQGDKVALRELDARLAEVEQVVLTTTEELFFP
ncbi:MAG: P-loop NTPase fold protein, partial [Candidatus Anammoxibacter sp.]